ncbi:MAG: ATP-binding protein [Bacteroidia bacterium]
MSKSFMNRFLWGALAALCFIAAYLFHCSNVNMQSSVVADFEKTLHRKELRLQEELDSLAMRSASQTYEQLFINSPSYYSTLLEKEGLALLIYENDTLKFWSDNSIAVENWIKEVCLDSRMAKLRNGWFEVMRSAATHPASRVIIGLVLIKNEFPYQNKYLVNEFQKDFNAPQDVKLLMNPAVKENSIKTYSNDYLFTMVFNDTGSNLGSRSVFALVANLLGFVFLLFFFRNLFFLLRLRLGSNSALFLLLIIVVALRYITLRFAIPRAFYDFEIFSPSVYADASAIWLASLGDLLINSILFFVLTYFVIKEFKADAFFEKLKRRSRVIFSFLLALGFFWFSWVITSLFLSLIRNSNIPFGINNLFSVNQYTYVALVVAGLLLFTYFLIADKVVMVLKQLQLPASYYIAIFILSAGIHALILHLLGILDLIIVFWPFVLIVAIVLAKRRQPVYPFAQIVLLVFLFSFYMMHVLVKHTGIKEMESRKIYAEKLAAEQDPVAEFLFQDIRQKLIKDTTLANYLSGDEKQVAAFEKRLKREYFSGFWEKYAVKAIFFDSMCVPVVASPNTLFDNNLFYDELITKKGIPTSCDDLSSVKNESGKISYLAKLPMSKGTQPGTLYIELDSKFISDEIGFPELLLDRSIGLSQELSNYSYAKYKHSKLVTHYGKFPYNLSMVDFHYGKETGGFEIIDREGFNHLLYQPDYNTLVVLSKRNEGIIDKMTTFSYLFTFFSLLLLSLLFLRQLTGGEVLMNFSFKYRIQLFLVFIVLTSLALFGGGTVYYIKQQFETKNHESISEKVRSVLMEMESRFDDEKELTNSLSDYITFRLKKLSYIFFVDVNLYDNDGNLYASSQPKVFNEGLTSKKMNPEAFLQMAVLSRSEFVHDERIGKLEYLSAYAPFKNKDGKILAYLNLPYFAKQNELEKEISGFLVALINIYVLLFALSIVTAILISNYVTKPLKLIQDKLSKIKLGKTNELIEWQEKDEIGSLVSEYNRMILELSKSAELLAKSERESAWREMAKQVAHEIKNPLTPMKLSVQHLMRVWKDNDEDVERKMERLTQTIIEQIDTLSTIATEFSNFAQMPKANLERTDIAQAIQSSIALFRESENTNIEFRNQLGEAFVIADKEQLLRVFNNLIKNAIQAIPEDRSGKIDIELAIRENVYIISIKDNGAGISEDVLDKIFVPNFTTKTAGMGLGLAMVKNIVESINGRIWFETLENKGTTFYISLPVANT